MQIDTDIIQDKIDKNDRLIEAVKKSGESAELIQKKVDELMRGNEQLSQRLNHL